MSFEAIKKSSCQADPEEARRRGQRLKFLRKLMRYTALAFSEKCATHVSTLKSWEQGRFTGLTTTGALRVLETCNAEGINCTLEWLLYGKGTEPSKVDAARVTLTITLDHINNPIAQELQVFHQLHPNAVDTIVTDDAMEPVFVKGDYVAGIRHFENDIDQLIGKNCIAQLPTGEVLVRRLKAGTKPGLYALSCINLKTKSSASFHNIKLFSAASVIWTRKAE